MKDPYEMNDVASDPTYSSTLKIWRARLVQQFVDEGRGETWVKDGYLIPRKKGTLYSPHYPSLSIALIKEASIGLKIYESSIKI